MASRAIEGSEFTRGQLATATGCNPETIRYYENMNLMPAPRRAENGYRIYNDESRKRLSFILRLKALGFSIEETQNVFARLDNDSYECGDIHRVTLEHLAVVQGKLKDLRKMEKRLKELSNMCGQGQLPDCPIIDVLYA